MYIQNTNSHIRIEFCDKCNVDKNKNRQELNLWLWIVNSFFNFIYFLLLLFFWGSYNHFDSFKRWMLLL